MASGSLSRASGENVGTYAISQNTYTYGSNYFETYVGADLTITTRAITITADAQSKVYGDVGTAHVSTPTTGEIRNADIASRSLYRASGENAGTYAINQNTYTY